MRTSDPHIFAVGDAIEVRDIVTGALRPLALAGPANRQGRIAAASIHRTFGSERPGVRREGIRFRGVQGTAVCGVFDLTAATTGATARALEAAGIAHQSVYLHPGNHVGYYPGSSPIHMKLLFAPDDGRILGAQAVGEAGVARRIDVIAMALQMGGTVFDLEECELCYAPQYGAAKDPVNLAGMIAANPLRGDLPLADWNELAGTDVQILDVRTPDEFERGSLPGARNLPLEELRGRLDELSLDRPVWLVCAVGQRAYYANRALLQRGYEVRILSGGMQTAGVSSARASRAGSRIVASSASRSARRLRRAAPTSLASARPRSSTARTATRRFVAVKKREPCRFSAAGSISNPSPGRVGSASIPFS
jgi:rhodanese-related sulfurtransferase